MTTTPVRSRQRFFRRKKRKVNEKMIPCTEFIPAYSELLNFWIERAAKQAVLDFWNYLPTVLLGNLRDNVVSTGFGLLALLSHTLNEEAADFNLELDEMRRIPHPMHRCPPRAVPWNEEHHTVPRILRPLRRLYRRILEPWAMSPLRHVPLR
jgi:hypothetical protein